MSMDRTGIRYLPLKDIPSIANFFIKYKNAHMLEHNFFEYMKVALAKSWILPDSVMLIDVGNVIGILFCYQIGEFYFSIVISDMLDFDKVPTENCSFNVTLFDKNNETDKITTSYMLPIDRKDLIVV
jgi:hypothetical protein